MAKVLKVTKADKTVHVVPISNKTFYQHMNNRILSVGQQMKLEEIDEKEAKDLPYFDENYVTGAEAQDKVSELKQRIAELEAQDNLTPLQQNIAKLEARLSRAAAVGTGIDPAAASVPYAAEPPVVSPFTAEEFTSNVKNDGGVTSFQSPADDHSGKAKHDGATATHLTKAEDVIEAIKKAKTVAEVNQLFNGDTRKTVIEATTKRINELNEAAK